MSDPEDDDSYLLGETATFSDWLTYIILVMVKEECEFPLPFSMHRARG
jgi:hypothetical protein